MTNVHFLSVKFDWGTPQHIFDELNLEFGFTVDVCATSENTKCERFFSLEDDGLSQKWEGVCWMNPPYGREIPKWIKKACESDAVVVCLIPSRTDTAWWHDYVMQADEIRFIRGRLKFTGLESMIQKPIEWSEPDDNGVRHAIGGISIMAISVDQEHVPTVNVSTPIILAPLPLGNNGERTMLPIDGWHRINKAYRLMGMTHLPAVVLTEEEADAITLD